MEIESKLINIKNTDVIVVLDEKGNCGYKKPEEGDVMRTPAYTYTDVKADTIEDAERIVRTFIDAKPNKWVF